MQTTVRFKTIVPPGDLTDIVHRYWILETGKSTSTRLPFRVVADGRPGMIIQCEASFSDSSQPLQFLYGQTTKHDTLYLAGSTRLTGVVFHSDVLKSLFGFDADEITDEMIDLDLIFPGLSGMIEKPESSENPADCFSIFFRKQKERNYPKDPAIQYSIAAICKSGGTLPLPELHKDLQLSERQFERRFKQHTGIPPMLFSRIIRFQQALKQVRSGQYRKLSDVAFDRGYSDQAHFIREFREFSGFRPGHYHSPDRKIPEICHL